jgi:hypothetical protein
VAATWPAVRSFRGAFVANGGGGFGEAAAGDHLQTLYWFWLVGHRLGDGHAPWLDPYSFQPLVPPRLTLGGWPYGLPFWPLEALFGPVVAWNVLLLATIVAAGLLTFAWLRALELPAWAAALGGLAYAVAPYRLEQSAEHLLGWIAVLLPLALLAIERARARRSHAWGALAAAATISIPLSGQVHLTLGAIPLVVVYAFVRGRGLPLAWVAGGVVGAIGVGLAVRYAIIGDSVEASQRTLFQVRAYQASWLDLLSRSQRQGSEQFVFLGWFTPALAIAGAAVLWRAGQRLLTGVLAVAAVVPVLLAVGTHLPTYELLWDAFPPFRYPRVPARLMPIANLAFAALAAVAAASLLRRRVVVLGAVLLVAIGADLIVRPFAATAADRGNAAYAAPLEGRMLELPLFQPGIHWGSTYLWYELQAPVERPGGYSTLAPEEAFDWYWPLNRLSCGVWLPGDAERLAAVDIGRIAFHRGLYQAAGVPGAWFGWRGLAEHGWSPIAADGPITLLARGAGPPGVAPVPEPPRSEPVFCEGWRGLAMSELQAPFWLYGEGTLELGFSSPLPTPARLWVDGEPRPLPAALSMSASVELVGRRWHWVMPEVTQLFPGRPAPSGLRLETMAFEGWGA